MASAIEISLLYEREALELARLESILAQIPEAVLVVDQHGEVVRENRAALALRSDQLTGEPLFEGVDVRTTTGEPVDAADLPLARALRAGETIQGRELAICTPDGMLIPMLASATPVRTPEGVVGAVAMFHDIRALKELERLRTEWTSLVAHDLRQPVNLMLLVSDVMLRDELADKDRPRVQRMRAAALRLDSMIEDLLDASRLEARELSVKPEPSRLVDLIDVVFEGSLDLRKRCQLDIASEAEWALADPGRIIQVLGNLLSNALKYSDPDTPIRVEAARAGGEVRIAIVNRGPDIAADELGGLFQRFARTRRARGVHAAHAHGPPAGPVVEGVGVLAHVPEDQVALAEGAAAEELHRVDAAGVVLDDRDQVLVRRAGNL